MPRELQAKDFEENRRTEPRMPCVRVIDILPCRAGKEWKFLSCELTDCSLHGLGVVSQEAVDVGQQFLVKLKISGSVKLLLYTVHNCSGWERSNYRIGARFSGFAAQELGEDLEKVLEALIRDEPKHQQQEPTV